jgi:hypothetical protein
MKYIIRFLVFSLLVSVLTPVFSASAQGNSNTGPIWLAATPGITPTAPITQVFEIDLQTMDVTITFSGIWAEVQTSNGQSFTRLWHEDYSSYREPGQPALPGTTFNLLVPAGAQVEVMQRKVGSHVVSLSQKKLPNMILPAQVQGTKSEPPPPWTPPDPISYARQGASPQSWYEIKDTFQMRDYTILPIWINPVRYKPASGEIELLEKIELRLTWPKLAADTFNTKPKADSPSFDRLVSKIVINPPEPSMDNTKAETGEGYLIITPDAFVDVLHPFVQMKQGQGYEVTVSKLSDIGSTTNEIKNYIQQAYTELVPSPAYLLLVGDTNLIPGFNKTNFDNFNYFFDKTTDLYYGTMDGVNDFISDIFVGRFPARTTSNLQSIIDKLINYNNYGYQQWNSQISFIASCDHYVITEGAHNDVMQYRTSPLGYQTFFPANENLTGGDHLYCESYLARTNDIVNSINNKRGIITYSGHGNFSSWIEINKYLITSNDLLGLTENYAYSFVSSFACLTNDFGNTTINSVFGETWMLLENKGAIAFLGSADDTIWGPDDLFERKLFEILFSEPYNPPTLKLAISESLKLISYPTTGIGTEQYYWETYNLLGDPSQKLWLVPDYKFEATTLEETKNGLISNTVKYPIEITNLGNTDTYSAIISGNKWLTETSVVTYLPYHSSETLWVTVHIPDNALAGESDQVDVTISSQNSDQTETFTFTTTALETFFTRFPLIFK